MSVNEVNECISRLECNKACGLDGVSACNVMLLCTYIIMVARNTMFVIQLV